jgi:hypothetical protein
MSKAETHAITFPSTRVLADRADVASAAAGPADRGGMTIELTKDGRHVGFAPLDRADAVQLALQTIGIAILLG